jgi:hypothetical protein
LKITPRFFLFAYPTRNVSGVSAELLLMAKFLGGYSFNQTRKMVNVGDSIDPGV